MKYKSKPSILKRCLSFFIAVCCLFSVSTYVSAHEIFYDGLTPYPLRWSIVKNGKLYLAIYNLGLPTFYSRCFSSAVTAWENVCSSKIDTLAVSNYSSANIVMLQLSKSAWKEKVGNDNLLAYCECLTTDGVFINNLQDAKKSSRKIKFAKIYLTPHTQKFDNSNPTQEIKCIMVHELGHALGLGHAPDIEPSIMRTPPYSPELNRHSYLPQSHDISDIAKFYK